MQDHKGTLSLEVIWLLPCVLTTKYQHVMQRYVSTSWNQNQQPPNAVNNKCTKRFHYVAVNHSNKWAPFFLSIRFKMQNFHLLENGWYLEVRSDTKVICCPQHISDHGQCKLVRFLFDFFCVSALTSNFIYLFGGGTSFLDNIVKFSMPTYLPTVQVCFNSKYTIGSIPQTKVHSFQDILNTRVRTTGVSELSFESEGMKILWVFLDPSLSLPPLKIKL